MNNGEYGGEGSVENVVRKIMGIMMRMKGGGMMVKRMVGRLMLMVRWND